jgi:DNA-binding NarL/FixJ family response regulator
VPDSRAHLTPPAPIRVPLVDDEEAIRRSVRRALEPHFEILEAADGAEAIHQLRMHRFDAVVTDLEVPNVDGPALLAWIDRHQPALSQRVLIVTGGPRNAARQRWIDAFDQERVLLKPCSGKELSDAIRRVARRGGS